MSIQQNSALFSLLGTTFGGNGTTTFGLPDLRGRIPINQGTGPGLSNWVMGQQTGTETVTLNVQQIPQHIHVPMVLGTAASALTPSGQVPAALAAPWKGYWVADANKTGAPVPFNANALTMTGGNQPHENRMPTIALTLIIALQGIFPSRN
jgi:microcystin-dependent protein